MRLASATLLALLAVPTIAAAQRVGIGQPQLGRGARAAALGDAFTAVADDATAMSWNPAGLARLRAPTGSMVTKGRLVLGRYDVGGFERTGTGRGASVSTTFTPLDFASVAWPFSAGPGRAAVGLSYGNLYDLARSYEYTTRFDQEAGTTRSTEGYHSSGGIRALSAGGAYAPSSRVMIGTSVSRVGGELHSLRSWLLTAPRYENSSESRSAVRYRGTAVDVGALLRPLEQLHVGIRATLPYSRSSTWSSEGVESVERTLRLPLMLVTGVAYDLNASRRLSLDYRHEPWSRARSSVDGSPWFPLGDLDLESLHVGFENRVSWRGGTRGVRAGAFTRPTLARDASGDRLSGYGLALGSGHVLGDLAIDLAATYVYTRPFARTMYPRRMEAQDNDLVLAIGLSGRR